jgi:hypothetical protein
VEPQDQGLAEPDIDSAGVDRVQIRAMLALTPVERLNYMTQFLASIQSLRQVDDEP